MKWSSEVSPGLVVRQKWHVSSWNLCVGDLVMICKASPIKAKHKIGLVEDVHPSANGHIRSIAVSYVLIQKNSHGEDKIHRVWVKRSVQRLSLRTLS